MQQRHIAVCCRYRYSKTGEKEWKKEREPLVRQDRRKEWRVEAD